MPDLALEIDGYDVKGWQSIQIQRSLDDAVDSFEAALTSPLSSAPPKDGRPWPGDRFRVKYDGALMITGYLDEVDESSDSSSFNLRVSGRSRAKDLVDCSALHKGAWRHMTLDEIAVSLAEPFGLTVTTDIQGLPLEKYFALADGETAFDAMDRLVRDHALRLVSLPSGDLLMTRTGLLRFPDVVIERGVNVISGGIRRSEAERHSSYIYKTQLAATDLAYGTDNSVKYEVSDAGVDRYRPLIVHAANQRGAAALKVRAEWERNTRAGRAEQLSYKVLYPGAVSRSWEMPAGKGLWAPNVVVTVRDAAHAIEGEYLVTAVTLTRSTTRTETQLELTAPEAYQPEKPPKKKKKGGTTF